MYSLDAVGIDIFVQRHVPQPGGGTQIWCGRESVAQATKTLPMVKGHFGRRYPFSHPCMS